MVTILKFAIISFIILCFASTLNATEDNLPLNNDEPPKDSSKDASPASPKNPSTGRVIRPSAWSKEEKENVQSSDDKNDQNMLDFDDDSGLLNMKKFFRYAMSLFYSMNESDDDTLITPKGDIKHPLLNQKDADPLSKFETNVQDERPNFENSETLNKLAVDETTQNPSTSDNQYKSSNNEKMENSSNNETFIKGQPAENPKIKMENSLNKDFGAESENAMKTQKQNPENSESGKKGQKFSNNDFSNDKDSTKYPKNEIQDSVNKDADRQENNRENEPQAQTDSDALRKSVNDGGIQNTKNNYILNKSSDNENMQKPSNNNSLNSMQPLENFKYNQQESNDENEDDINGDYESDDDENENDTTEDDANENNVDENSDENDYINDSNHDARNVANQNNIKNYNVNENNHNVGKISDDTNKKPPSTVSVDQKSDDISNPASKFLIQDMRNKQNNFETHFSKNEIENNDKVTPENNKSETITNKENPSPKFKLSSDEFIDEYMNNRQGQFPEKENKQASNIGIPISNKHNAVNKDTLTQILASRGDSEEDNKYLNAAPPVNKNMKDRNVNIPFDQSRTTKDNLWPENNAFPLPVFNADKTDVNPNQDFLSKNSPRTMQITHISADKPNFSAQEDRKDNEMFPPNLIRIQQQPQFIDLQHIPAIPQKDYNTFAEPRLFDFQNINPSIKAFNNDKPSANVYRSELIIPSQIIPNKPIYLQNEGYLNDQYTNYNFPEETISNIYYGKDLQFEDNKLPSLQQNIFPNIQHISKQESLNAPDENAYLTNYKPITPLNIVNIKYPETNTESFSNYLISNTSESNPSSNQMYNQNFPPTDIESNLHNFISQNQLDTTTLQNQITNTEILNKQKQSDTQSFQDNFTKNQILLPQNNTEKTLQQNEIEKVILPDRNKISSNDSTARDGFSNIKFPQTKSNRKKLPYSRKYNSLIRLKNHHSTGIPENLAAKSFSHKMKVSSRKPFVGKLQKKEIFDKSEGQKKGTSSSDSYFPNNQSFDESSHSDYYDEYDEKELANFSDENDSDEDETGSFDCETDSFEDETDSFEDETDSFEDETDSFENESEDDYSNENNYSYEDNLNEDENEDDYTNENNYSYEDNTNEDEDEDDYANENNYSYEDNTNEDEDEDYYENDNYDYDEIKYNSNDQNPPTVSNSKENTVFPTLAKETGPYQQNLSQRRRSQIKDNSGDTKSRNNENSSRYTLINGKSNDDDNLKKTLMKEDKLSSLSDETEDPGAMLTNQKTVSNDMKDDVIQSSETTQNKSESSDQKGKFNTLLEYIYKFSNNSLFKGIRNEKN